MNKYRDWSSPRSEAKASGWCCLRSRYVQIPLIFSSPVTIFHHMHILCICYGMVLANTAVLCMHVRSGCLTVRGAPGWVLLRQTLLCCDTFSSTSVVSCTFSVLCVYSKFAHHPHPLGYLCAKFCFFRGPIAELAVEKSRILTQSLEAFALE